MIKQNEIMTDIYIHIGTHKTGSSTIQSALRSTSKAHPEEGWRYARLTTATATEIMQTKLYDEKLVRRFKCELQRTMRRVKSTDKVILSSEALSGLPIDGYRNSNAIFSMLRDATKGHNVKIVIFLRRQDSFVESMYTQKIHEGGDLDFESFVNQFNSHDALDYHRMLTDLRSYFGDQDVIVRSYHASSNRDLLTDFGDIIGSKALRYCEQVDKNPSYSRQALEIARICNRSLGASRKRQLRHALQTVMAKKRSEPFSYFTDDSRTRFLNRYNSSNLDVANRYFDGNLEKLFPPPEASKPSYNDDSLSYDDVAELVIQILNENPIDNKRSGILAGIRFTRSDHPPLRRLMQKVQGAFRRH